MREFEEVYRVDGVRLVAELHAITGSLAEAEDIVQEAFARAYARWRSVGAMDARERPRPRRRRPAARPTRTR